MKKIIYIVSLFVAVMTSSCDDFLEPKSQDKIIPKTVVDLKEFLLGEVIKNKEEKDPNSYLAYMTDDVGDDFFKSKRRDKKMNFWGYYSWQVEPEIKKDDNKLEDMAWDMYYHKIFVCNVILDQLANMEGADIEKDALAAETHFMRAHCYFMLVNLYGEPYDKLTAETALGVPVNEEVGIINKRYARESVATIYAKIKDDLTESIRLFTKSESCSTIARPSLSATYLLMSRMYLYTKDYTNTEKYATLAITINKGEVVNLNSYSGSVFMSKANTGIIFTYGAKAQYEISRTWNSANYKTSDELLNSYTDEDLRKSLFLKSVAYGWRPMKFTYESNTYGKAYRIYEAYLNRAEANAELKNLKLAKDDMKYLYALRHDDAANITTEVQSEVIDLVRKDRRLEFCFEDSRWFDLRRYGMPRIEHRYITAEGDLTYVLEAKSKAYTLPIPRKTRELNLTIERIDRPIQINN